MRWSANRKSDVVLRLLRGEKLEDVSGDIGVEAHRVAAWRDEFLADGRWTAGTCCGNPVPRTPRR